MGNQESMPSQQPQIKTVRRVVRNRNDNSLNQNQNQIQYPQQIRRINYDEEQRNNINYQQTRQYQQDNRFVDSVNSNKDGQSMSYFQRQYEQNYEKQQNSPYYNQQQRYDYNKLDEINPRQIINERNPAINIDPRIANQYQNQQNHQNYQKQMFQQQQMNQRYPQLDQIQSRGGNTTNYNFADRQKMQYQNNLNNYDNHNLTTRRMEDMMTERNNFQAQQTENLYAQNINHSNQDLIYSPPRPEPSRVNMNQNQNQNNSNNNQLMLRRDYENFNMSPYSFQQDIEQYNKSQEDERMEFEREERRRRDEFEEHMNKKSNFLKKKIKEFEENYNPYEILGLSKFNLNEKEVKKAYKKMALKYHPDKAGPEYSNQFQLITQAYIYLLNKCEEENKYEKKFSQEVKQQKYEDDINESGVYNIYLNKDKFDINTFNDIFQKYHIDEDNEGYGHLYKEEDNHIQDDSKIFGNKFNKEIFNATFDDIKKNRRNDQLIEYQEPQALVSANVGFKTYGDFGGGDFSGSSSIAYTDYKKAHVEETLLIDPSKVKYKEYKNIDQLKSDRERISYEATPEDSLRYKQFERARQQRDEERLRKQQESDKMWEEQYKRINKKLIINK